MRPAAPERKKQLQAIARGTVASAALLPAARNRERLLDRLRLLAQVRPEDLDSQRRLLPLHPLVVLGGEELQLDLLPLLGKGGALAGLLLLDSNPGRSL